MYFVEIMNLKFSDSSDKEVLYEVIEKETEDRLLGHYGKFKACMIGTDKEYLDDFPLIFESKEHAEVYLKKYLDIYNGLSGDEESKYMEDFEIRETHTVGFGQVVTFDYKEVEKTYKWEKKQL